MTAKSAALGLSALALAAVGGAAHAGGLAGTFFELPTSTTSPDFGPCCSSPPATSPVIVLGSALGPDGLPVTTLPYTPPTAPPGLNGVADQNSGGEIGWWTPGSIAGLVSTGTGSIAYGVLNNMFAPSSTGTNPPGDSNYFETAILTATLTGNGSDAKITVGSDDDALVYVNGFYVGGVPGVHSTTFTTIDLGDLTGTNSLQIFYADRAMVAADLEVSVSGAFVPEPASWAMMVAGVGGLGAALRRKRQASGLAAA